MGGKKILKAGLCLALCLVFAFQLPMAGAGVAEAKVTQSDLDELNNKLESLKKEQQQLNEKLAATKDKKEKESEYKASLDSQISNVQEQINILNTQIETLDSEISTKEAAISDTNQRIDENYELLKKRLRTIYMTGEASSLSLLFDADSLVDYMNRTELVQSIAEHDTELIESLQADKSSIEQEKAEIESAREEVAASRKDYEVQKKNLDSLIAESNRILQNLSQTESDTIQQQQATEAQFAKVDKEIEEWYKKYQEQQQEQGNDQEFVGGTFLWPMPGYASKANLGDGFGGSRGHRGMDINGANIYGKTIVAANSGTVAYATNANTAVYGKYLIIDHGGGVSTLYGHCSNVMVTAGQTVTRGQAIAQVGSTGVATGPHLHFGVLINGVPVDPMQYFTLQ